MAESIFKLRVENSEYDSKLKKAAEGIQHLAKVAHDAGGSFTNLEKSELDFIKALGDMNTVSKTASGSARELETAYKNLAATYNQLSDDEKNDEGGKALAASLEKLRERAIEARASLDDATNSLKPMQTEGTGTSGVLSGLFDKMTINIDALKLLNMGLGAASSALSVAKDAFFANENALDEWGRTVSASESLYHGFLNALNNSDISGFLSKMDDIVEAAKAAYNAMDDLNTYNAFMRGRRAEKRSDYSEALNNYKLNPTAENKQALAEANKALVEELRTQAQKTRDTYEAELKKLGTERGLSGKQLDDFVTIFKSKNYEDLQAAKASYSTGRGLNIGSQYYYGDKVYDGRTQDRSTGLWRDLTQEEKAQFEFARALSQVNDKQIDAVQALDEQYRSINNQINNQNRSYNRFSGNNGKVPGSGGKGGGRTGGGSGGGKTGPTYAADSVAAQQALVRDLQKQWSEAGAEVRNSYIQPLVEAENKLKQMQNEQTLLKEQANGRLLEDKAIQVPMTADVTGLIPTIDELREYLKQNPIVVPVSNSAKDAKEMQKDWQNAASAISSVGSAMASIEDPAGKVMGTVAQAIAIVALAYAKALETDWSSKSSIWSFIAAAAAGTASMITTIASIHSATGYAQGGIVKGNSYSGDNIGGLVDGSQFVGLNAGEVVLTQAMAGNLASQIQDRGTGNLNLHAVLSGENIVLSANRYLRRSGRGEIATWKN